jgi:exodeoxyribonuclease VII large subunit
MTKRKKDPPKTSPQLSWSDWSKLEFPKTSQPALENQNLSGLNLETRSFAVQAAAPAANLNSISPNLTAPMPSESSSVAHLDSSSPSTEPAVLTVSALNKLIRRKLEGEFATLWIKGEISNFKAHPSGHFYFSLKDKESQISAVMFRAFNTQLRFKPEDGMEVIVRGKVTVYEPRGNYQVFCETMEPVGAGALQKAFEQLKMKLQAEGLFDSAKKRPIPIAPKHIAIVTSPSGAAIRDMLNVLSRRYRAARITVVPCAVQGVKATQEIVRGLEHANLLPDVDVIIVGRGGGSIEDMWSFNEEPVARAIAGSRVPVISAVGHEVDFTIADFVADLRAPTPSAAAELVAKNADEMANMLQRLERTLVTNFLGLLNRRMDRVISAKRLLVDPRRRISDAILRCDELLERLERAVYESLDRSKLELDLFSDRLASRCARRLDLFKSRFVKSAALLDGLSPLKVLDRGYAIASLGSRSISSVNYIKAQDVIEVRVADGTIEATVIKTENLKNT